MSKVHAQTQVIRIWFAKGLFFLHKPDICSIMERILNESCNRCLSETGDHPKSSQAMDSGSANYMRCWSLMIQLLQKAGVGLGRCLEQGWALVGCEVTKRKTPEETKSSNWKGEIRTLAFIAKQGVYHQHKLEIPADVAFLKQMSLTGEGRSTS